MTVAQAEPRRARKAYVCDACGALIHIGEHHRYIADREGRKLVGRRVHSVCPRPVSPSTVHALYPSEPAAKPATAPTLLFTVAFTATAFLVALAIVFGAFKALGVVQ